MNLFLLCVIKKQAVETLHIQNIVQLHKEVLRVLPRSWCLTVL